MLKDRWEFRPAFRGDAVVWAREPEGDDAWPHDPPPVPPLVTEVARTLRLAEGEDRPLSLATGAGEVWQLQRATRSRSSEIRGAVVTLTPEPPRADLAVRGDQPADHEGLAHLAAWLLGLTRPLGADQPPLAEHEPQAPPGVNSPLSQAAWWALHSRASLAQLVRERWQLSMPCAFVVGAPGVLKGLRRLGLPLLSVVHAAEPSPEAMTLARWCAAPDWDALRGVVAPRPLVDALLSGALSPERCREALDLIAWLHGHGQALSRAELGEVAAGLDRLEVAHRLRGGRWQQEPRWRGLQISITPEGVVWRTGPLDGWEPEALLGLTEGADAAPEALREAARVAVERQAGGPEQSLYWQLRGMPVAPETARRRPALDDVLDWLAGRRVGDVREPLLAVAEAERAALGPRPPKQVTRLAKLLRGGRPSTPWAFAARCLALCEPDDRALLLTPLGLDLTPQTRTRPWLRHAAAPVPTSILRRDAVGGVERPQAASVEAQTSRRRR